MAASLCLILQDLMPSSLRTAQKEPWCWLWLLSTPDKLTLLQEPFANDEFFSGGRASDMIVDWPYRFWQRSVDETRFESTDLGFCYPKEPTYDDHWSHTALAGSVVFIPSYGRGLSGDSCCSIVVVDIIMILLCVHQCFFHPIPIWQTSQSSKLLFLKFLLLDCIFVWYVHMHFYSVYV